MTGVPVVGQWDVRMQVWPLASLGGLRIWPALSCSVGHRWRSDLVWLWQPDSNPSLGTSICRRCGPRNKNKKKIFLSFKKVTNAERGRLCKDYCQTSDRAGAIHFIKLFSPVKFKKGWERFPSEFLILCNKSGCSISHTSEKSLLWLWTFNGQLE